MEEFDFVAGLPTLSGVKDARSVFINLSHHAARLVGWKSAESCQGKTDYDLPSPASQFADKFVALDKKVLENNEPLLTLETYHYSIGWKLLLAERTLLFADDGKPRAIFTTCIDISDIPMYKGYALLNRNNSRFKNQSRTAASYLLSESYCPLSLTARQQDVVFFLIRGKSAKEIAKILHLSYRTVEFHMENIKNKLNCNTKSEVIETAIEQGFLYYIPESLRQHDRLLRFLD